PAGVEDRFQRLTLLRKRHPDADDPLFRPLDADDFRSNGEHATDFSNLRQNGLVRITFRLPPNIRVIDPATNAPSADTFVDVWRTRASGTSGALTGRCDGGPRPRGPSESGGCQLDARVATLQERALGAVSNHARLPMVPS